MNLEAIKKLVCTSKCCYGFFSGFSNPISNNNGTLIQGLARFSMAWQMLGTHQAIVYDALARASAIVAPRVARALHHQACGTSVLFLHRYLCLEENLELTNPTYYLHISKRVRGCVNFISIKFRTQK